MPIFRGKRKRTFAPRPLRRTKRFRAARVMPVKIVKTRRFNRTRGSQFKNGIVRDKRIVSMRYQFDLPIAANTAIAHQRFRANGLFDPDSTGAGHQPRGFDQFMALYDKYVVLSARITLRGFEPGNSNPFVLAVRASEATAGLPSNILDLIELKGGQFRVSTANAGTPPARMKLSVNIARFFNRSGGIQDDPDLQGTSTADPTKLVEFRVSAVRASATDTGNVLLVGWIDFKVMLLEPKLIAQS